MAAETDDRWRAIWIFTNFLNCRYEKLMLSESTIIHPVLNSFLSEQYGHLDHIDV